eukprot:1151015-Pelagomonas_calceolata.AAC.2
MAWRSGLSKALQELRYAYFFVRADLLCSVLILDDPCLKACIHDGVYCHPCSQDTCRPDRAC